MATCRAAIFDLDGTLFDSLHVWSKIDVDFLGKRGLSVPDFYAQETSTRSFREAADYTIELFGLPDTAQELMDEWNAMALEEYSRHICLKPHAEEYLHRLKASGLQLAAATSLPAALYTPALQNNGIYRLFNALCSADEVPRGKNDPDLFLLAAERLGARPCDCVVFEDVLPAIRSAKRAGMTVFGVQDPHSASDWDEIEREADGVIVSYADAPVL